MERSEQTGLAVALIGHVVVFGLLSAQFLAHPPAMRPPETPLDVSLVEEVAPVAQAPEQAPAPAPSRAPDAGQPADAPPPAPLLPLPQPRPIAAPAPSAAAPAPAPPPRPAPKPSPATPPQRAEPKPAATPPPKVPPKPAPVARVLPRRLPKTADTTTARSATPAATPAPAKSTLAKTAPAKAAPAKPAPAKAVPAKAAPAPTLPPKVPGAGARPAATKPRPTGSRLDAIFSSGVTSAPSKSQVPAPPKAVVIDAKALAGIQDAIARQLQPCADRQVNPGPGANQIVTVLNLRLNRDGRLAVPPAVVRQSGLDGDNDRYSRRVIDLAVAAFNECAPLKLPPEYYATPNGGWNNINYNWQLR